MLRCFALACCLLVGSTGCIGNIVGAEHHLSSQSQTGGASSQGAALTSKISLQGLRLLTNDQYVNSVHDLLGSDISVDTTVLPPDNESSGMVSVGNGQATLALSALQAYETSAYALANAAFADDAHKTAITGCPNATVDANCLQQFVTSFGARAFRRSLTADEIARYTQLIGTVSTERSAPWIGMEHGLAAMLQSPYFLFRSEIGTPTTDPNATTVRLTDYELAARLSYLIVGSTPDAPLLQAAANGNLATSAG